MTLRQLATTGALLLLLAGTATAVDKADTPANKPPDRTPKGYKLLYWNSFDDADATKGFHCTDAGAWRFNKQGKRTGAFEQFKASKYKYKVRSPYNIALIDNHVFGDFILECDLRQTGKEYGHRDMCLFFGVQERSHFYYVHIASKPDPHAHNVFIVNDKPRTAIAKVPEKGIDWGKGTWQHVRIERVAATGDIKVFFNGKLIHETKDTTFKTGFIGFGSFDDTGMVDNVRIWGPSVTKKKADVFPQQK